MYFKVSFEYNPNLFKSKIYVDTKGKRMKLIINEFMPISQKSEIDLSKKFTVFVGKNNSGKTYVSQLIWAINSFSTFENRYYKYGKKSKIDFIEVFDKNEIKIKITKTNFNKILKNFTNYIVNQRIKEVFKHDIKADIKIDFDYEEFKKKAVVKAGFKIGQVQFRLSKEKDVDSLNLSIDLTNILEDDLKDFDFSILNKIIEGRIIELLLDKNSIYMPSTRLFLPTFYKYIYTIEKEFKDAMLGNIGKIDSLNKSYFESSYTKAVDDLIKRLVFQAEQANEENKYLKELETLIEGNISVDKAEVFDMVDLSYTHKSGEKLPMYLSSSMVNQLATLYLYFKYWFKDDGGNFLLLDEPEMNLHQEKKLKIVETLLNFASENKLLIATHSSSMAKSIINYIHLFDLQKSKSKEEIEKIVEENNLQMRTDLNLSSNDIGIYYFSGDSIVSYKEDGNSNIHFGTFTDLEKLQNIQYESIMNELENDSQD